MTTYVPCSRCISNKTAAEFLWRSGHKCHVAVAWQPVSQNSYCCLIALQRESQWAEFHGPNANARHNSLLYDTNTEERTGSGCNFSVTEPQAPGRQGLGCHVPSHKGRVSHLAYSLSALSAYCGVSASIKNARFSFWYMPLTLASVVRSVLLKRFFFFGKMFLPAGASIVCSHRFEIISSQQLTKFKPLTATATLKINQSEYGKKKTAADNWKLYWGGWVFKDLNCWKCGTGTAKVPSTLPPPATLGLWIA